MTPPIANFVGRLPNSQRRKARDMAAHEVMPGVRFLGACVY